MIRRLWHHVDRWVSETKPDSAHELARTFLVLLAAAVVVAVFLIAAKVMPWLWLLLLIPLVELIAFAITPATRRDDR